MINLEETLDNLENLQLEVSILPETFDEYIKGLPLMKQPTQKKAKKTKGDEFTSQEIK